MPLSEQKKAEERSKTTNALQSHLVSFGYSAEDAKIICPNINKTSQAAWQAALFVNPLDAMRFKTQENVNCLWNIYKNNGGKLYNGDVERALNMKSMVKSEALGSLYQHNLYESQNQNDAALLGDSVDEA